MFGKNQELSGFNVINFISKYIGGPTCHECMRLFLSKYTSFTIKFVFYRQLISYISVSKNLKIIVRQNEEQQFLRAERSKYFSAISL